jgi:hypothetical protein
MPQWHIMDEEEHLKGNRDVGILPGLLVGLTVGLTVGSKDKNNILSYVTVSSNTIRERGAKPSVYQLVNWYINNQR